MNLMTTDVQAAAAAAKPRFPVPVRLHAGGPGAGSFAGRTPEDQAIIDRRLGLVLELAFLKTGSGAAAACRAAGDYRHA